MARILGTTLSVGAIPLYAQSLELEFILNDSATTTEGYHVVTRREKVTPDEEGNWSVTLVSTASMIQYRYYLMIARWLDAEGGYIGADFPVWKLRFGGGDHNFEDLTATGEAVLNNGLWWVGEYPDDPPPVEGALWLDPVTGNVYGVEN